MVLPEMLGLFNAQRLNLSAICQYAASGKFVIRLPVKNLPPAGGNSYAHRTRLVVDELLDVSRILRRKVELRREFVEVAKRLREMPNGDKFVIVAVTGYGQAEDRQLSQEAGFDEPLLKPVALDTWKNLFRHPKLAPRTSN